jgi:hypothetical protein
MGRLSRAAYIGLPLIEFSSIATNAESNEASDAARHSPRAAFGK